MGKRVDKTMAKRVDKIMAKVLITDKIFLIDVSFGCKESLNHKLVFIFVVQIVKIYWL